jgi:putative tricarboxylic transport membrane protein
VAPSKLSYVAYAGGGPAQAALLGSHVAAGISGYGEFAEQIKAGKLRAIAISADKRQPGIEVPTLKEQGVDVELFNWRGVFAPPGTSKESRDALVAYIERMVKTDKWREEATKRDWTTILLTGDAYSKFLDEEIVRIESILKDLGLAS